MPCWWHLLWDGHSCPAPCLDACLWSWEPGVPLPYPWASARGLETVCWHRVLLSRWASAFVPAQVFQRGWLCCGISAIVASAEKQKEKHLQFFTTCFPFLFVAPIQHLSRCLPTKCSGRKMREKKAPPRLIARCNRWNSDVRKYQKSYLSMLKIHEGGAAELLEGKPEVRKETVNGLSVACQGICWSLSLRAATSWGV